MAASAFKPFVPLFNGRRRFFSSVHISREHKFILFNNPKVACSTTKASLNRAVASRAGKVIEYSSMADIHSRDFNILETPQDVGNGRFAKMLKNRKVTKFAFVRDPVSRFCSAYLSKFGPAKQAVTGQKQSLCDYLGRDANAELSLTEFAEICAADHDARDLDPHWRLQRKQIAFDLVDFTFIGNQARWQEDFDKITAHIFEDGPAEVFDSRHAFQRFTSAKTEAEALSAETRQLIESTYAEDYVMMEEIEKTKLHLLPSER